MGRVQHHQTTSFSQVQRPTKRNKPSYKVTFEQVSEKKKLKKYLSFNPQAPPGYTFIPAGDPQLTNRCKKVASELDSTVYIVSMSKPSGPELSQEVHRVGCHFASIVVDKACDSLGVTLTESGRVARSAFSFLNEEPPEHQDHAPKRGKKRGRSPPRFDVDMPQATIDTQAREAISDLFPKIPHDELHKIVARSFQKGQALVGTSKDLSLVRRVHLAVIAHIRHVHTDYDQMLREMPWIQARRTVESRTLDTLVKWRGDNDADPDVMHDVLREVIVIPDDDENEDGQDDDKDPELSLSRNVTHTQPKDVVPVSDENIHTEKIRLTSVDLREPEDHGTMQFVSVPRNTFDHDQRMQEERYGARRVQRWEEAVSRQRNVTGPFAHEQRPLPPPEKSPRYGPEPAVAPIRYATHRSDPSVTRVETSNRRPLLFSSNAGSKPNPAIQAANLTTRVVSDSLTHRHSSRDQQSQKTFRGEGNPPSAQYPRTTEHLPSNEPLARRQVTKDQMARFHPLSPQHESVLPSVEDIGIDIDHTAHTPVKALARPFTQYETQVLRPAGNHERVFHADRDERLGTHHESQRTAGRPHNPARAYAAAEADPPNFQPLNGLDDRILVRQKRPHESNQGEHQTEPPRVARALKPQGDLSASSIASGPRTVERIVYVEKHRDSPASFSNGRARQPVEGHSLSGTPREVDRSVIYVDGSRNEYVSHINTQPQHLINSHRPPSGHIVAQPSVSYVSGLQAGPRSPRYETIRREAQPRSSDRQLFLNEETRGGNRSQRIIPITSRPMANHPIEYNMTQVTYVDDKQEYTEPRRAPRLEENQPVRFLAESYPSKGGFIEHHQSSYGQQLAPVPQSYARRPDPADARIIVID